MRGKVLLVVGLGVGYVLGARAGRERYEEIVAKAQKFWGDPRVQKQVVHTQNFVKDKAPDVAEFLSDSAKKVATQVTGARSTGAKKPAPRKSPTTRSTTAKS